MEGDGETGKKLVRVRIKILYKETLLSWFSLPERRDRT